MLFGRCKTMKTITKQTVSNIANQYIDNDTYTFEDELELLFEDGLFSGGFNRLIFNYQSSSPIKVFVTYSLDGEETNEYFYFDANKTEFRGLITGYLQNKIGASLKKLTLVACEKKQVKFTLSSVRAETLPLYDDVLCIENRRFKIGTRLSWGGALYYYEDKMSGVDELSNLINVHDVGRLIQQSFYGTRSNGEYVAGHFSGREWPYNPVQAGDLYDNTSRLIDVEVGEEYIYTLSQPLDWALENKLTAVYYENKYILNDDHVLVENAATDYSGWIHPNGSQEVPAVYLVSYFDTLCFYNGDKPWSEDKDGLNYVGDLGGWGQKTGSYRFIPENSETWVSWINTKDNFAFGVYCPNAHKLIAIRHRYNGTKNPSSDPATYVAPSVGIAMQPYKRIVYSYILSSGTPESVRDVFLKNKDFCINKF